MAEWINTLTADTCLGASVAIIFIVMLIVKTFEGGEVLKRGKR